MTYESIVLNKLNAIILKDLYQNSTFLEIENIQAVKKHSNNVEKRLIAFIQVSMTSLQLPGGQIAKSGSVINFLSPDIEIAQQLPVANHLMLVRFTNSTSSLQTFEVPSGCPT
jgi:hypothetical protein